MTTNNSFPATKTSDGNWKAPDGQLFRTPDDKAPIYGTRVNVLDGNGGSKSGWWLGNHVATDSNS